MAEKENNCGREREQAILDRFITIFCAARHGAKDGRLCAECEELAVYARERLERCPHHPKPSCKKCLTHCYKPAYRERIREVMRFSGLHLLRRGRLDLLFKYYG